MLAEWAYVRPCFTNRARLDALPAWVDDYSRERSHGSLAGHAPMTVLVNNVSVKNTCDGGSMAGNPAYPARGPRR